jgi:hypothetical protein
MIWTGVPPIATAASIVPFGTSRKDCSTSRAKKGMAAIDRGMEAASGLTDVPNIVLVNGIRAMSKMMNGKERTVLIIAFNMLFKIVCSSNCSFEVKNVMKPMGRPNKIAANIAIPTIKNVWPIPK